MDIDAKNSELGVYRTTGFLDILASPVFYTILIVTLILGLLSVFGFLQNPYKFKVFVNAVHQKVSVAGRASSPYSFIDYSLVQESDGIESPEMQEAVTVSYIDNNRYSIFSESLNLGLNLAPQNALKHIAYDYDITSKKFWGDLELPMSVLDSDYDISAPFVVDTPLDLDMLFENDDAKYSMKSHNKYRI